jgi:uncharacterized protein (TIRG00374 family)
MRSAAKQILRTVISFALAGFFLYLAFRQTDFGELWSSLKNADYLYILLLIPITLLSHWVRAVRWAYLLAPIKPNTSRRNLFSAVMIGYLVNNALPRVGELVRPYVLGNLEGISRTSALGTVVIERILDVLTFYFIASVVLFAYPSSLSPFFEHVGTVRPLLLASSIVCFLVFVLLFFKAPSFILFVSKAQVFLPKKYHDRFERLLNSFLSGFAVSKMKDSFVRIAVLSFLMQGLYALSLYVPFYAFQPIAALKLDAAAAIILLTVSSFAFVLPVPGGLGTYHSLIMLTLIKLYHVDLVTAGAYSLITHEVGYILVTVVGLYYFMRDHVRVSEVTLGGQQGEHSSS